MTQSGENPSLPSDDLQAIVDEFNASHWQELELEFHETKLFLSKNSGASPGWVSALAAPAAQAVSIPATQVSAIAVSPATAAPRHAAEAGQVIVSAPSLGTFYRSAKPGTAPFSQIGDLVEAETELCLIEVMKLFTTLRAGVKGRLVEILVDDGAMVEHDQPLFVIDTNG